MNIQTNFTWKTARQTADNLVFQCTGKYLSDIEITILRGAWNNCTYEEIAEAEGYTSNYLSKDVGRKLWGNLSVALQEKVSKKNFKAALRREWQNDFVTEAGESLINKIITYPEGSIAPDSLLYIERSPIESICYEAIAKPGSLIRIKGTKWMGKTSLVNRILEQGELSSQKTIYLDFANVEKSILMDLDKLLCWFCAVVSRQLKLTNKVEDYWDLGILGSNESCTIYFEEHILTRIKGEILLALDNVDRLFSCQETTADFLRMLRNWHERGKTNKYWARLKLIITHSIEAYISLDIDRSPFNAGVPILLNDFNTFQVKKLADLYKLNWNNSDISKIVNLVGGHPHLVRLAMYEIKTQNITIEQFLATAISETGVYGSILQCLSHILKRSPKLNSTFTKAIVTKTPIALNSLQVYQLQSLGVIKFQRNSVALSCRLFRDYFLSQ